MAVFKNIHMKFWQNDFVLGLTAEERYFYIYLITNSMTTQCGVYKFNRRLAELETGYSCEEIESFLKKFEDYGKVVISKTSTEIMLVNWLKHNFMSNKKTLLSINKELKDVKDKELLKKLYDFCCQRQYPVNEIFSGIAVPCIEIVKVNVVEKEIELENPEVKKETRDSVQESGSADLSLNCEEIKIPKESEGTALIFTNNLIKGKDNLSEEDISEVNEGEEALFTEDCMEEESEEILEGTTIAFWEFSEPLKESTKKLLNTEISGGH